MSFPNNSMVVFYELKMYAFKKKLVITDDVSHSDHLDGGNIVLKFACIIY